MLGEVASAAEQVAADQREVARRARVMQRQRERGWSWARILDHQSPPGLVALVRRSGRRLSEEGARLSRFLIAELAREGESRRQIAARLGVTHQRVSTLANREHPGSG